MRPLRRAARLAIACAAVLSTSVACQSPQCVEDCGPPSSPDAGGQGTDAGAKSSQAVILRDTYGVPHVFADDLRGAVYGWGYAYAQDSEPGRLLELYYAAMGQSAAAFGHSCPTFDCPDVDLSALELGVPQAVEAGYASLSAETRLIVEAYAAGVNAALAQLDAGSRYAGREVTPQMVVALIEMARVYEAIANSQVAEALIAGGVLAPALGLRLGTSIQFLTEPRGQSNQFAVKGAKTTEVALVGSDPHSPWTGRQAHVHLSYGGFDVFGYTKGGPMIGCGGNSALFYGCSTLHSVSAAVVEAQLSPDRQGYFDHAAGPSGGFVPFETKTFSVDVAGEGPAVRTVKIGRFGRVFAEDGARAAMVASFATPDLRGTEYATAAWRARSAQEYLALFDAARQGEIGLNRAFATAGGDLGYVYGGHTLQLDDAVDWSRPVPSTDPRVSWNLGAVVGVGSSPVALPSLLNPAGDLVQNSNGHPAFATAPQGQIPLTIPRFLCRGRGPTERDVRLLELLQTTPAMDVTKAQGLMMDVKVPRAENVVEALRRGLVARGSAVPVTLYSADVNALLNLLLGWRDANGYRATTDSEAMTVLFLLVELFAPMAYPAPGATFTPAEIDGIATALADVARYMRTKYAAAFADPLRVRWGYLNQVQLGNTTVELPGGANALQSLFIFYGGLQADGRLSRNPLARRGSHSMRLAVYGRGTFEIYLSTAEGQVSHAFFPSSPHVGQTLGEFAQQRMRRVWLSRDEVEAHLCPFSGMPGHEHTARTTLVLPELP